MIRDNGAKVVRLLLLRNNERMRRRSREKSLQVRGACVFGLTIMSPRLIVSPRSFVVAWDGRLVGFSRFPATKWLHTVR